MLYPRKVQNRHLFKQVSLCVLLCAVALTAGCDLLGVLLSRRDVEVAPRYDIRQHKGQTIYIVVHVRQSSGADIDLPEAVSASVSGMLALKAGFEPDQLIDEIRGLQPGALAGGGDEDIEARAREAGAALLLYIEIAEYDLFNVHGETYYTGNLVTYSALTDLASGKQVWPASASGRRVEAAVEMETRGRTPALGRLTAATAHCIVRELVPTFRAGYRCADEKQSIEDIMKELE